MGVVSHVHSTHPYAHLSITFSYPFLVLECLGVWVDEGSEEHVGAAQHVAAA